MSVRRAPERDGGWLWGGLVVGWLALVVLVNLVVIWLAGRDRMDLVTEDYYQQGLAYDEVQAAGARARAAELHLEVLAGGEIRLWRHGRPWLPHEARAYYYRPNDADADYLTTLVPVTATTALRPMTAPSLPGLWRVIVRADPVSGPPYVVETVWYKGS